VETVTVIASRHSGLSEMEMLIGSAVVIALLAWSVLSRMRRGRQPHA